MKILTRIALLAFTAMLLYGVTELPPRGDPEAPASQVVSPADTPVAGAHYIQHAYEDAATPNMVTVVLADYRGWDTLGEVVVVFTAAICCLLVLRRRRT